MRAIRNMEDTWAKINGRKFALVDYTDAKGEKRPCYALTKTESLYIATKFNDEARAKLVLRWEELERSQAMGGFQIPQSFAEALTLAGQLAQANEEQARALALSKAREEEQERIIEEQKPKVFFAQAVETSKSSCLIGELAKIIAQNGYPMGQNRLFRWLKDNKYLIDNPGGENNNVPYQQYMERGYFELKKSVLTNPDGSQRITRTTKVTGKGQVYFVNKFLQELRMQNQRSPLGN